MNVLTIGLGSMGKRRIRNLLSLGYKNVAGFDPRADRCKEAEKKYNIKVFDEYEKAIDEHRPKVFIISTPPNLHMQYAYDGYERKIHCFIEASVTDEDRIRELGKLIADSDLVIAPSCTMRFFPGPKKIKELLKANAIGEVLNITYQTGQYLPDWHPWEDIQDYYVSKTETGACREIVPFELTWLNDLFGDPEPLACIKAKLTDMNADIDDIYHCLLQYPNGAIANVVVEVISQPHATREMRVLGSKGMIVFSADERCVRYTNVDKPEWTRFDLGDGTKEKGYINPEEPYIAEIKSFMEAVKQKDKSLFPNTLLDDTRILQTLHKLEALSKVTQ